MPRQHPQHVACGPVWILARTKPCHDELGQSRVRAGLASQQEPIDRSRPLGCRLWPGLAQALQQPLDLIGLILRRERDEEQQTDGQNAHGPNVAGTPPQVVGRDQTLPAR